MEFSKLIILCGRPHVVIDCALKALREAFGTAVYFPRQITTREPRPGEKEDDYIFISNEEFEKNLPWREWQKEFWAEKYYGSEYYGYFVSAEKAENRSVLILEVPFDIYCRLSKKYGRRKVFGLLLWRSEEFLQATIESLYDMVVFFEGDRECAVDAICKIISAEISNVLD